MRNLNVYSKYVNNSNVHFYTVLSYVAIWMVFVNPVTYNCLGHNVLLPYHLYGYTSSTFHFIRISLLQNVDVRQREAIHC